MEIRKEDTVQQPDDLIFVLDIGTRSIIGLAGTVEDEKLKVTAIESAEHKKRAMIDGQIEDIGAVAKLAKSVKERVETKLGVSLNRVCVAAAGRALKTERTSYEMDIPEGKSIDGDLINQLESGAIEQIEQTLSESAADAYKLFYLVGYSAVQYYLDDYPISNLFDHHGSKMKVDILATFLPSEVVESLYTAMQQAGLEVASMTLEPIAAINAAIPENLRLLNLSFADIGAGTSDIAVCKDGNIVGYTMATIAGDEITEALMKEYLIDFETAEQIKADLDSKKEIYFTDIMGFEQSLTAETILESLSDPISHLCKEIAEKITEVNGGAPSAVFLAGGGSKLKGILEGVTEALQMDEKRVAIAGSNFKASAFSKEYDLNNPEYATPLGIAVSTGLNLINDSYHVMLNGKRAKLFRNGQLKILNVLMMNGYQYRDLFGRSGSSLIVTVDGKRTVLYGKPATNSKLMLNGQPAGVSDLVKAGDVLEFIPAEGGEPAKASLADVLGADAENCRATVNGEEVPSETMLKTGDVIETDRGETRNTVSKAAVPAAEREQKSEKQEAAVRKEANREAVKTPEEAVSAAEERSEPAVLENAAVQEVSEAEAPMQEKVQAADYEEAEDSEPLSQEEVQAQHSRPFVKTWHFTLNDKPVTFPAKPDHSPYLLLDMLQHSGLDFDNLTSPVVLAVNGMPGIFQQELRQNDSIIIRQDEE